MFLTALPHLLAHTWFPRHTLGLLRGCMRAPRPCHGGPMQQSVVLSSEAAVMLVAVIPCFQTVSVHTRLRPSYHGSIVYVFPHMRAAPCCSNLRCSPRPRGVDASQAAGCGAMCVEDCSCAPACVFQPIRSHQPNHDRNA